VACRHRFWGIRPPDVAGALAGARLIQSLLFQTALSKMLRTKPHPKIEDFLPEHFR
jgi:hypothetical protein